MYCYTQTALTNNLTSAFLVSKGLQGTGITGHQPVLSMASNKRVNYEHTMHGSLRTWVEMFFRL